MPGVVHEVATSEFGLVLWEKTAAMGLDDDLKDTRATRYQGIPNSKEPASAFKPKLSGSGKANCPTLAVECGVSQSLDRLKSDANWWLKKLFRVHEYRSPLFNLRIKPSRTIHLEQWEMDSVPNPLAIQANPDVFTTTPTPIQTT
ncbi:hypothetical protein HOY82DRAFT_603011 [Tuber indicum]|nr:hypothetical protein HOY82DRAFT_603011 [Tuber indicum]